MPSTQCAIYSCKNSRKSTDDTIFHSFPRGQELVSQTILKEWIRLCKRKDTINPSTSSICSSHFTENDYERDLRNELLGLPLRKKLKKTAVPTLNLPSNIETRNNSARQERITKRNGTKLVKHLINHSPNEILEEPEPAPSETLEEQFQNLLENYNSLQSKYEELKVRSQKKIKTLSAQVKYYKSKYRQKLPQKHNTGRFEHLLRKVLTTNQITLLSKKKKLVRWTQDEISIAFTIRYYSKKCYLYLKNKLQYPLPSLSSLRRWASSLNVGRGILSDVLMMLKLAAESFTMLDKTIVISFDEVKIKKIEEYDIANDEILGPYNQMQVIMVRSLFSSWKQPVYINFDQKMTKEILFNVISQLHHIGYNTVACVCDCGGGNIGLWKELNITIENTHFKHPETNTNVYMFADAPHLLKLIRNWLLDKGFEGEGGIVIDKKPLEALLSLTNTEVNACWKISSRHITCENTQRQNVKLAAQLLSNTVSTALLRYKPGEDKVMSENLGNFISDINKWFDIFNSHIKEGVVPTKNAYGINLEAQKEHLNKIIHLMSILRVQGKSSLQIFQKGILISATSLHCLFEDMKHSLGIHYICTHKLNQDCLENFFSQIRSRGPNDHPSPLEAIKRIRMIILGKNPGILGAHTNTVAQEEAEYMVTARVLELASVKIKIDNLEPALEHSSEISCHQAISKSSSFSSSDSIDLSDSLACQETTTDALEYIAGYLAKKYKDVLPNLGDYSYRIKSDHTYNIPSWVQQLSYGGLIKPTNDWVKTILRWNIYFEKYHGASFVKGGGIVKKLTEKIARKEKMPFNVIKDFCKLRTIIRIKYRNLLMRDESVSFKRKDCIHEKRRISKKMKKLLN